jgi:hypothetical protein
MLKDEDGKELNIKDYLRLRFPEGVKCQGTIEHIYFDPTGAKRGSKKSGSVIVRACFSVPFNSADEMLRGIVKLPEIAPGDYVAAVRSRKISPKGVVRIPKADRDRVKRSA